MLNDKSLNCNN